MSLRRIHFRQSGGFAGLIRGYEIDATDASPWDLQQIERLLKTSGLAQRAKSDAAEVRSEARDLIQYELDVETSSGTHHVLLTDDDLNDRTAPLVRFLQDRSKPMKL